jgi:hypothetical protein
MVSPFIRPALLVLPLLLLGIFAIPAQDSASAHCIAPKDWKAPTAF